MLCIQRNFGQCSIIAVRASFTEFPKTLCDNITARLRGTSRFVTHPDPHAFVTVPPNLRMHRFTNCMVHLQHVHDRDNVAGLQHRDESGTNALSRCFQPETAVTERVGDIGGSEAFDQSPINVVDDLETTAVE